MVISIRYGEWLANTVEKLGLPVIESKPWPTVLERAIDKFYEC